MLVVWIPCEAFSSWVDFNIFDEDDFKRPMQLERLLDNLFGIIAISGIYYHLRESTTQGATSFVGSLGAGFRFWGPMFATRFIIWTGILVCAIFPIFVCMYLNRAIGSYIGLAFGLALATYLYIRMSLCEAIVAGEEMWGFESAHRSYQLTKGKFWRTFGWLLGGCAPAALLGLVIYLPFDLISFTDNWIGDSIGAALADIPLVFCFCVVWAVFNRLREEEYAAHSVSLSPPESPSVP